MMELHIGSNFIKGILLSYSQINMLWFFQGQTRDQHTYSKYSMLHIIAMRKIINVSLHIFALFSTLA